MTICCYSHNNAFINSLIDCSATPPPPKKLFNDELLSTQTPPSLHARLSSSFLSSLFWASWFIPAISHDELYNWINAQSVLSQAPLAFKTPRTLFEKFGTTRMCTDSALQPHESGDSSYITHNPPRERLHRIYTPLHEIAFIFYSWTACRGSPRDSRFTRQCGFQTQAPGCFREVFRQVQFGGNLLWVR